MALDLPDSSLNPEDNCVLGEPLREHPWPHPPREQKGSSPPKYALGEVSWCQLCWSLPVEGSVSTPALQALRRRRYTVAQFSPEAMQRGK